MTTKTIKDYIEKLAPYILAGSENEGRPRSFQVKGNTLFWCQGQPLELYCMDVVGAPSQMVPRKAMQEEQATDAKPKSDGEDRPLTKEEELLRERTRSRVTGVTSYKVRNDGVIIFTSGLDLYYFFPGSTATAIAHADTAASVAPFSRSGTFKVFDFLSSSEKEKHPALAARPSMYYDIDASRAVTTSEGHDVIVTPITFVNSNNLYEMHIIEDLKKQQPFEICVKQLTSIGDELHPCGVADYITQEEFDRQSAHMSMRRRARPTPTAAAEPTSDHSRKESSRVLTLLYSYTDCTQTREVGLLKGTVSLPETYPASAFDEAHNFRIDAKAQREESLEMMPYPRVGDSNTKSCLALLQEEEDGVTVQRRYLPPGAVSRVAPWAEYMPRFDFKNETEIYFSVLDRRQERYAVYSCYIKDLPVLQQEADLQSALSPSSPLYREGAHEVPLTLEWQQYVPWAWVEVQPGPPIFFTPKGDFIVCHATQETFNTDDANDTAHFHLFYRQPAAGESGAACNHSRAWVQLTCGPWNVSAGSVQFQGEHVYFTANAHDRIGTALYRLSIRAFLHGTEKHAKPFDAAALTRISPVEDHLCLFALAKPTSARSGSSLDSPCQHHWSSSTSRTSPPTMLPAKEAVPSSAVAIVYYISTTRYTPSSLYRCRLDEAGMVAPREKLPLPPWLSEKLSTLPVVIPRVVTVNNRRGVPLSGCVFISPVYEQESRLNEKAPLAMYVYGGPHVQLVHRHSYYIAVTALIQVLLQQGIHVAVVDNQMSNANGLRDLSICKNNMGHFETKDYVDFARYLTSAPTLAEDLGSDSPPPYKLLVDPARVAIFGWSYGGYATLLAMCQAADVFRIGFAGAPVGDWRLYDTGYTERYLGTLTDWEAPEKGTGEEEKEEGDLSAKTRPVAVRDAYLTSAISHHASGFPDDLNRVFIAHGLLDENVHFTNSCSILQAMIAENKPYSMLVYPGERHGLRQKKQSRLHHDGFLVKTLSELL